MCLKTLEFTTVYGDDSGVQQCQQGGIHFLDNHAVIISLEDRYVGILNNM